MLTCVFIPLYRTTVPNKVTYTANGGAPLRAILTIYIHLYAVSVANMLPYIEHMGMVNVPMSPGAARFVEIWAFPNSKLIAYYNKDSPTVQLFYLFIPFHIPINIPRDIPTWSKRLNGQLHCHSNALPLAGALHNIIAHLWCQRLAVGF